MGSSASSQASAKAPVQTAAVENTSHLNGRRRKPLSPLSQNGKTKPAPPAAPSPSSIDNSLFLEPWKGENESFLNRERTLFGDGMANDNEEDEEEGDGDTSRRGTDPRDLRAVSTADSIISSHPGGRKAFRGVIIKDPEWSGWMRRPGEINGRWQERYASVKDHQLHFAKTPGGKTRWSIDLSVAEAVCFLNYAWNDERMRRHVPLVLLTPTKTWQLALTSQEQKGDFLSAITRGLERSLKTANVIEEDWLMKQGETTSRWNRFKFVYLSSGDLLYFDDGESMHLHSRFRMPSARDIVVDMHDGGDISSNFSANRKLPNRAKPRSDDDFRIMFCIDNRVIVLQFETEQKYLRWKRLFMCIREGDFTGERYMRMEIVSAHRESVNRMKRAKSMRRRLKEAKDKRKQRNSSIERRESGIEIEMDTLSASFAKGVRVAQEDTDGEAEEHGSPLKSADSIIVVNRSIFFTDSTDSQAPAAPISPSKNDRIKGQHHSEGEEENEREDDVATSFIAPLANDVASRVKPLIYEADTASKASRDIRDRVSDVRKILPPSTRDSLSEGETLSEILSTLDADDSVSVVSGRSVESSQSAQKTRGKGKKKVRRSQYRRKPRSVTSSEVSSTSLTKSAADDRMSASRQEHRRKTEPVNTRRELGKKEELEEASHSVESPPLPTSPPPPLPLSPVPSAKAQKDESAQEGERTRSTGTKAIHHLSLHRGKPHTRLERYVDTLSDDMRKVMLKAGLRDIHHELEENFVVLLQRMEVSGVRKTKKLARQVRACQIAISTLGALVPEEEEAGKGVGGGAEGENPLGKYISGDWYTLEKRENGKLRHWIHRSEDPPFSTASPSPPTVMPPEMKKEGAKPARKKPSASRPPPPRLFDDG